MDELIPPAPETADPETETPFPQAPLTDTPTDRFIHIDRKLIAHDRALGEIVDNLGSMQRSDLLLTFAVCCACLAVLLLIRKVDALELPE